MLKAFLSALPTGATAQAAANEVEVFDMLACSVPQHAHTVLSVCFLYFLFNPWLQTVWHKKWYAAIFCTFHILVVPELKTLSFSASPRSELPLCNHLD